MNILTKDEQIMSSPSVLGYQLLRFMQGEKADQISIFDIAEKFSHEKWFSPKGLYFAMIFLFSLDLIDFQQSYISLKKHASD